MYTDFNHFYCYNKKCTTYKSKTMPAISPLFCNPHPYLAKHTLLLIRFDLVFTYKMVFGLIDVNLSDFFKLRSDNRNRGHQYKLFLPGCSSSARHNFFTYRAAKMWWNDLPSDSTDFSSLSSFKRCLTSTFLARHSKVYFFLDVLSNFITDYRR